MTLILNVTNLLPNIAHVAKLNTPIFYAGIILGDPRGEWIRIDHPIVKPSDIRAVKVLSKTASKCALALFFSKECLVRSLATETRICLIQTSLKEFAVR